MRAFVRGLLLLTVLLLAHGNVVAVSYAIENPKSENYTMQSFSLGATLVVPATSVGAPEVLSNGPTITSLTDTSVTITWLTSQASTSMVEYGITTVYGTESGNSTEYVDSHTVTIKNLQPETKYYYRIKSVNVEGEVAHSDQKNFTTPSSRGIRSISISDVTYTTALISYQTGNYTKSELNYGKSTDYGQTWSGKSLSYSTDHAVKLSNLSPGTTYHFRVVATSEDGSLERSSDFTFKTNPDPAFTSIEVVVKNAHEVDIVWQTASISSGVIEYYEEGKTRKSSLGISTLSLSHTTNITGLLDNTTYKYTIVATDMFGRQVTSTEKSFKTSVDVNPPKIENLRVNVTRSGEDLVMSATWRTNKLSIGKAIITPSSNPGKVTETLPETQASIDHILVKTGLDPSTVYTLRAISIDTQGNQFESKINFITPNIKRGILGLIAESFSESFGWVNKVFGGK